VGSLTKRAKGQAAVEYVLLILVVVVVFGWLFYQIRRDLFRLWVCEIGPRVQSTIPCRSRDECFGIILQYTTEDGRTFINNQKTMCDGMYQ